MATNRIAHDYDTLYDLFLFGMHDCGFLASLPQLPIHGRLLCVLQSAMMPPQTPRFLSHDRTTTVVALPLVETQKFGRSYQVFDSKQKLFLLLSNQ